MDIHAPSTILAFVFLVSCGCRNIQDGIRERPLKSELPKYESALNSENLSEQISLKANILDNPVIWGKSFRMKVSCFNLSPDTLEIITGYHTLTLETTQDTSLASVIDSLEHQMNGKILVTLNPYTTHPEIKNDVESNSKFNSSTGFTTLFPLDTLSETVSFNCTASPGLHRVFRLVYNTENYKVSVDTNTGEVPKMNIATGKLISKPFYIDIIQPADRD